MTPEEFKKDAQEIYDRNKGYAGVEGHMQMDDLMEYCLRSLGYGEGIDILFSMSGIWYA